MKNSLKLKEKLYAKCLNILNVKQQNIEHVIFEIQQSLTSETKSSAGDKHETGRAMMQLEREKAGQQLAEILKQKELFSKINITKSSNKACLGSIVLTTQANYFLSISVGEIIIDSISFFAISPNTPIGLLLLGKEVGDKIAFRDQKITIKNII